MIPEGADRNIDLIIFAVFPCLLPFGQKYRHKSIPSHPGFEIVAMCIINDSGSETKSAAGFSYLGRSS